MPFPWPTLSTPNARVPYGHGGIVADLLLESVASLRSADNLLEVPGERHLLRPRPPASNSAQQAKGQSCARVFCKAPAQPPAKMLQVHRAAQALRKIEPGLSALSCQRCSANEQRLTGLASTVETPFVPTTVADKWNLLRRASTPTTSPCSPIRMDHDTPGTTCIVNKAWSGEVAPLQAQSTKAFRPVHLATLLSGGWWG